MYNPIPLSPDSDSDFQIVIFSTWFFPGWSTPITLVYVRRFHARTLFLRLLGIIIIFSRALTYRTG